ncbi:hypothetical protein INR49_008256, partial [Caranx melampygus]
MAGGTCLREASGPVLLQLWPVEVALPGLVFDLSSLVLYGAQAVPVRLKILLDRLYSILTPEQVGHILHTLGWSLGDYVRGYMLQYPSGKVLDRWTMVTPEEELLVLKQFLRFGETRPIVELMTLQCLAAANYLSCSELKPASKSCQSNISTFIKHNGGTPVTVKKSVGDSCLEAGDLAPPMKLAQKPNGTKLAERHRLNRGRGTQENDSMLQLSKGGRKGRVCCGVCGKSFYDKGTLKIHYNAVHLKIKHRCTVAGCTMVFSSLRSRNRHSANPNPLHSTPSVGSPPSLIPLVVPVTEQTEHCQPLLGFDSEHTAPAPQPDHNSCNSEYGCSEGRRGGRINQQRQWESGDPMPKKKPRKSSMPVKIAREHEGRRNMEEDE